MPYVNVKVAGPLTKDQRTQIAERISSALHDIAGKKPETTYIVFEEVERDRWAVGGKLLSE
jgi:4-oxalocrotonate tautomerase